MKLFRLWTVLSLLNASSAFGDEVPFAQPPAKPKVAPLAEIMGMIQFQHIKLWQAVENRNWDLISYEAAQLEGALGNSVVYYLNIPVEYIAAAGPPLNALENAAAAKDTSQLEKHFTELTNGCNSCHQAGGVGYIKIVQPTFSPFGNQQFAPAK